MGNSIVRARDWSRAKGRRPSYYHTIFNNDKTIIKQSDREKRDDKREAKCIKMLKEIRQMMGRE